MEEANAGSFFEPSRVEASLESFEVEVTEQLTFRELLQDPIFKAWMKKVPTLRANPAKGEPWRVYGKTDGYWGKKEFFHYPQAFNWVARHLSRLEDCAIHCKRQPFRPPVVKDSHGLKHNWPMPPKHRWCGLCRRPTVFGYFNKHHALPGVLAPYERRCSICGVREKSDLVRYWHTTLKSRWSRAGER